LGILFCFPYAIYYYFDNKEQVWVCPECKENVSPGAGTCKHCSEDLSQHTSP
jgi:predicted amidophosphoribosyltransferase